MVRDRQTDRETGGETDGQTDRQTETHRQAGRQADRDRQTDRQTDSGRQTDRQTETDRQTDRQSYFLDFKVLSTAQGWSSQEQVTQPKFLYYMTSKYVAKSQVRSWVAVLNTTETREIHCAIFSARRGKYTVQCLALDAGNTLCNV